jgi:hypothetical protein
MPTFADGTWYGEPSDIVGLYPDFPFDSQNEPPQPSQSPTAQSHEVFEFGAITFNSQEITIPADTVANVGGTLQSPGGGMLGYNFAQPAHNYDFDWGEAMTFTWNVDEFAERHGHRAHPEHSGSGAASVGLCKVSVKCL